jgi:hypothetical protein
VRRFIHSFLTDEMKEVFGLLESEVGMFSVILQNAVIS